MYAIRDKLNTAQRYGQNRSRKIRGSLMAYSKSELSLCLTLLQNICATLKSPCDPNYQRNTNAIIKKWKSVESVIRMTICYNVKLWEMLHVDIVKLLFFSLKK